MTENKWLTKKEMSKEAKVSVQVINNWIKRENIKWKKEPRFGIILVDSTSLKINPTSGRPKKVVGR